MFIQEILDTFGKIPDEKRKSLILDNYKFKDGIYIMVHKDLSFDVYCIDNKKEIDFRVRDLFAEYDYYSNYINSNKSIDSRIYSANPFTYFTKISVSRDEFVKDKDGTLNPRFFNEIYFNKLENIYHMNLNKNFISFLEIRIDEVFQRLINLNMVKEDNLNTNDTHIKFFYETDAKLYKQEYEKYEEQRIFNSNDSNIEINGVIFGTSNFSNSYNSYKRFICPKTMPSSIPFLISIDEARILRDFSQWVKNYDNNFIQIGYNDNFEQKRFDDCDNKEYYNFGYIIQTETDKNGLNIVSFDNYGIKEEGKKHYINHNMNHLFPGNNFVVADKVEQVLNYELFGKALFKNYFSSIVSGVKTDSKDKYENKKLCRILKENRRMLFNSFYRNKPMSIDFLENTVSEIIDEIMLNLIYNNQINSDNVLLKLSHYERIRLNLLNTYQYQGDKLMENNIEIIQSNLLEKLNKINEVPIVENDAEYYFLMGQLLYYFFKNSNKDMVKVVAKILRLNTLEKAQNYTYSIITKDMYSMKYFHCRLSNAISCIHSYKPQKYDRDSLVVGLCLAKNIFYVKNEDNQEENENEE